MNFKPIPETRAYVPNTTQKGHGLSGPQGSAWAPNGVVAQGCRAPNALPLNLATASEHSDCLSQRAQRSEVTDLPAEVESAPRLTPGLPKPKGEGC